MASNSIVDIGNMNKAFNKKNRNFHIVCVYYRTIIPSGSREHTVQLSHKQLPPCLHATKRQTMTLILWVP